MSTERDWARELFDRSRGGEEPAWVVDAGLLATAGLRRKRARARMVSGSVVAVIVAAAVGISVSGTGRATPVDPPHPSTAPPARHYASMSAAYQDIVGGAGWRTKDAKSQDPDYFKKYYIAVPDSTVRDTIGLLTHLDPTLGHVVAAPHAASRDIRLVPDSDQMAQDMDLLSMTIQWTPDGQRPPTSGGPSGSLALEFHASGGFDATSRDCPGPDAGLQAFLDPVSVGGGGWTNGAKWSPCTTSTLKDGSVVMTRTKTYGPYYVAVVARQFPHDGGSIFATWSNYSENRIGNTAPDPKSVLPTNPVTVHLLVAALSDPSLVPGLTADPITGTPSDQLQASDFGPGWRLDSAQSHGTTGALVVDNGCDMQQNPVAKVQPMYAFAGTTPSGLSVTATVGTDIVAKGSGPAWMAKLRQHGTGGCDQGQAGELKYSQDTMSPLPAGTGDDAFIEHWVGQGNETIFIRFGDGIFRLDVSTPDHKMPTFTSADRTWFAGLAAKAAARHAGKG
jgi:hypothetical protein